MLTLEQAQCLYVKRPDVPTSIQSWNPELYAQGPVAVITAWWAMDRTGDASDAYATPEQYAVALGCGGGGGLLPPGGQLNDAWTWMQDNPLITAAVAIGVLAVLFRQPKQFWG